MYCFKWVVFIFFLYFPFIGKCQYALPIEKTLNQFILQQWDAEKGLPASSLNDVCLGPNKFIWLASYSGLIQFDGLKFRRFSKYSHPNLGTNNIYEIENGNDHDLWIGTHDNGLVRYKDFTFENIASTKGLAVQEILVLDSVVVLGTRGDGAYEYYPYSGRLLKMDSSIVSPQASVRSLFLDSKGVMWVGTEGNGLTTCYLKSGEETARTVKVESEGVFGSYIAEIYETKLGDLLVGTDEGLFLKKDLEFIPVNQIQGFQVNDIFEDINKSLWVITDEGVFRKNKNAKVFDFLFLDKKMIHPQLRNAVYDHEGHLWMASNKVGLLRLMDSRFDSFSNLDGLASISISSIEELEPGKMLVGTDVGVINIVAGDEVTRFTLKSDIGAQRIRNLLKDSKGNIWISTYVGLVRVSPTGKEYWYHQENCDLPNVVRMAFEDSKGQIWIGTRSEGVFKWKGGYDFEQLEESRHKMKFVMSIGEDFKGNILVGTNTSGVFFLSKKGVILKHLDVSKGLVSNLIFNVRQDDKGVYWVAANGGISRIKGGDILNFSSKNGLKDDSPFDIIEDEKGVFWIPTVQGVMMISKDQFNKVAINEANLIHAQILGPTDGIVHGECTGASHSMVSSKGEIWIPGLTGVTVVLPHENKVEAVLPKVFFTDISINGEQTKPVDHIAFPYGKNRLEFSFTALTYTAPDRSFFKYRLLGYDDEWSKPTQQRTVVFTNLPSGKYTLEITGALENYVWNRKAAKIRIKIVPPFYQTWWFWTMMSAFILFILKNIVFWQFKRMRLKNLKLARLVNERTKEVKVKSNILEKQKDKIKDFNDELQASIRYAKRIQEAVFTLDDHIKNCFKGYFIFSKPKQQVSGDFCWMAYKNINGVEKVLISVADCTGHGVPGAFMSMVGDSLLNQIVHDKNVLEPSKVLSQLHQGVRATLWQEKTHNLDGMDISFATWEVEERKLTFSGAMLSMLIYDLKSAQLTVIKGDRLSIGGEERNVSRNYTSHEFHLPNDTLVYFYTDGFQDQFGGTKDKKFKPAKFRAIVTEIAQLPIEKQREAFEEKLYQWMNPSGYMYQQVDDIMVVGVRF